MEVKRDVVLDVDEKARFLAMDRAVVTAYVLNVWINGSCPIVGWIEPRDCPV